MAERVFSNVVRNPIFRPSRVRLRHQQLLVRCVRTNARSSSSIAIPSSLMARSSGLVALGLLALFLLAVPFARASWLPADSLTCVPATSTVMERSEGRSRCAYDSRLGYRAIGVGYNLDDKSDERMREIATIVADFDKLYRGEECLNDVQINALLAFDARRYLIRAKERIEKFNSFCCNVQSIFADIAFTHAKTRLGAQFSPAIERAQSSQYKEAAEDLRRSKWCRKHEQVCRADTRAMEEGCPTAAVSGSRKVGESWLPADSLTCVPATTTVMERSEGRSRCAYDSRLGYRAIGVGYNLDDKSDERMREIATILADYDKLYSGEACLNDLQINTLLALDARRFLLRAGESVKALDNFCCNVQAVFADIAFTHSKSRLGAQFDPTIQKASSFQWREAAEELRQSKWCRKNKDACTVDTQQLEEGCSSVGDNAVSAFLDRLRGFMAA
ncbi:unnamed protein product [Closterium sp. NIES-53]